MVLTTAVIGAGTVSIDHLSALKRNPQTEPVAVCDVDEERAREAAREYGISPYTDIDRVLSTDLDWVHVCTPVQTHLEVGLRAINAGVPAMIEKPITLTSDEFEKLQSVARTNAVQVFPVHNWLFYPVIRRLRANVAAGQIGRVIGVDILFNGMTRPNEANRGSWVFDLAGGEFEEALPHPIYLTLAIGGYPESRQEIVAITNLIGTYDSNVSYDSAQVQYVGKNGRMCGMTMLSGEFPQRYVSVYGTEGMVVADLISGTLSVIDENYHRSPFHGVKKNLDTAVNHLGHAADAPSRFTQMFMEHKLGRHSERSVSGHYSLINLTAKSLLTNSDPPVSLEQAGQTIGVMEEIRNSASE
jgi:predicted dehydrogenase